VEAKVAVAPVQRPGLVSGGVAQPGDREAGPFRSEVLTPWRARLDDRQVPRGELALHADLVAGVLGYPCGAPPLYSCHVQLWQGRSAHQPSAGLSGVAERVECGVKPLPAAPAGLVIGLSGHESDQLVQVVAGGRERGAAVRGWGALHQWLAA